jgi:hypothetical protein
MLFPLRLNAGKLQSIDLASQKYFLHKKKSILEFLISFPAETAVAVYFTIDKNNIRILFYE